MTKILALLFAATLGTAAIAADTPAAADKDGFVPLFDGKTMTGWKNGYDWGTIEVKDGEIHLTGEKKFFVVTEKSYSDFIFEGDVHLRDLYDAGAADREPRVAAPLLLNVNAGHVAQDVDGAEDGAADPAQVAGEARLGGHTGRPIKSFLRFGR